MYTVYVLQSITASKSYVGMTDNLKRRLLEHNIGQSSYTKSFLPWKVVYTEIVTTREVARKREKYLKSSGGRKFLKTLFA